MATGSTGTSPTGLDVAVERHDGRAIVRLAGELDMVTTPELERVLRTLQPPPLDTLVFEVSALTFIDSSGLRLTLGELERARDGGYGLMLAGAGGNVLHTLCLTGLEDVVPRVPSLAS